MLGCHSLGIQSYQHLVHRDLFFVFLFLLVACGNLIRTWARMGMESA
jgi:hypothetical protein